MVVVGAVIIREGLVLACQRSRRDKFPLKWEFPGGKIEAGETPREALARELREELGVEAIIGDEIYRTRHTYDQMREPVELIFFAATIADAPVENRVFENMEWTPPHDLEHLDFLEADRELIHRLATRKNSAS